MRGFWRAALRLLAGVLAGALAGATLFFVVVLPANPIHVVVGVDGNGPVKLPDEVKAYLGYAAMFAAVLIFLGGPAYWILRRVGRLSTLNLLIVFVAICFVGSIAGQLVVLLSWHIPTADSGGAILKGGVITPHGWERTFRRAVAFHAVLGLAMAWVFCLVAGVKAAPPSRPSTK